MIHTTMFNPTLDELITLALNEDIGGGDRTTAFLVDPEARGTARVTAKQELVVAGMLPFMCVFEMLDPDIEIVHLEQDGTSVGSGAVVAEMRGSYGALLTGERTALNFLQRLSGVATLTKQFVDKVQQFPASILDTRKTTPGWRSLEKEAVLAGGGCNHRMGLYDAVLIKENHIAAAGGIRKAITRVKELKGPHLTVEVEVRNMNEFKEALDAGPDMIMLDNMPCHEVKQAVMEAGGRIPLEASGNMTLETVEMVAATGIQYISVGALTHSAPSVDVSMIIQPEK